MANEQIGRLKSTAIALESTYGTIGTTLHWISTTSRAINPTPTHVKQDGSFNSISDSCATHLVKNMSSPSIGGYLDYRIAAHMLNAALGTHSASADDPESGVTTHTFTLNELSVTHPSYTIYTAQTAAGIADRAVAGCRMSSLTIEAAQEALVTFTSEWMGKQDKAESSTAAYTKVRDFQSSDVTVKFASTVAGLAGATAQPMDRFMVNITKNAAERTELGSIEISEVFNGTFNVTGDFDLIQRNDTFRDYIDNDVLVACQFEMTMASVTIGASTNPKITITIPSMKVESWSPTDGNDDLATETCGFTTVNDSSRGGHITAVVINDQALA
jgi:hypothetical protein